MHIRYFMYVPISFVRILPHRFDSTSTLLSFFFLSQQWDPSENQTQTQWTAQWMKNFYDEHGKCG